MREPWEDADDYFDEQEQGECTICGEPFLEGVYIESIHGVKDVYICDRCIKNNYIFKN